MRISKNIIRPLFVLPLLLLFIACSGSGSPSKTEIETAIKQTLKEDVPVQLSGYMGGGRDAIIKEIKIIEIGKQKGEGSNQYWAVKVFLKGDCEVGSKWSGNIDPLRRKSIKGEVLFYLFRDDFGKWKAKHKGF